MQKLFQHSLNYFKNVKQSLQILSETWATAWFV